MRKAGTKTITNETMTKVWKLHEKQIDARLIAETLGISGNSARRIISIMTAAQNGGDVDAICGKGHLKQKAFAKKYFGIEEPKEELTAEQEEAQTFDEGNFKEFAVRVLFALSYQNKLLEKLCEAWGVSKE